MRKYLLFALILFSFYGCDLFEYHPYDGLIRGEKNINAKNIARIEESCKDKTTIRYVFFGDTQRHYDETEDFVKAINKRNDIDFVIHGGDVSDFGMTKEFTWIRDIMNKLTVPYVVLIGNHDCLANGEHVYREVFGVENFSFLAGNTKFICLNTNALEYDYSHPIPDFVFMENQYYEKREGHEKTIFAMHVRPYSEQFNNNVAGIFHGFLKEFPKLQFCMNAHDHATTADDLFDDGVIYYGTPNIAQKKYLLFTIKPNDEYEYEVVEF